LKLVCDEGVERPIVDTLRADGHDVSYIAELQPGIGDDEVFAIAEADAAIVVTTDKDFGELVFRQGLAHHGVVLLRLHGLTND
jgi:predicted nuclease of predicted toxin-antitoxin system